MMLVVVYPLFIVLSKMGGMHIASAMTNVDIMVYPFVYFGFQKAILERLPIEMERIKLAKSIALYIIILCLFLENILVLSCLGLNSAAEISNSFFRVNLLFGLALLFSGYLFQNHTNFQARELVEIPIKILPLAFYLGIYLYVFETNDYMQIFSSLIFYPLFEVWDYFGRKKLGLAS